MVAARHLAQRLRSVPLRYFAFLSRGGAAFALCAAAVIGLAALELSRGRLNLDASGGAALSHGDPALAVFPFLGPPPDTLQIAADTALRTSEARVRLWAVERTPEGAVARLQTLAPHRGWIPTRSVRLSGPLPRGSDPGVAAVEPWGPDGRAALLFAAASGARFSVAVWDLDRGRRLLRADTATGGTAPVRERWLGFGRWSGSRPDLFVIDRRPRAPTLAIRIFSGESGFHRAILDVAVPVDRLPGRSWHIVIGEVASSVPDITVISGSDAAKPLSALVLSGLTNFQQVALRERLPVSGSSLAGAALSLAHVNGEPYLWLVAPGARTMRMVRLQG